MGPNLPVIAKKLRSIIRVIFFMLKNNISKSKLIVDLNMMMKRGKIAGKTLQNLMFHHNTDNFPSDVGQVSFTSRPGEYEFSCSNTPAHFNNIFPFLLTKKGKHHNTNNHHHSRFFSCAHAPATDDDGPALVQALEMLNSEEASPALPGFGRTPMVRQLRVTDSPFPLRDVVVDSHVDEAAEEFITKFYNELRHQNKMASSR
ncbi:hypothetical protein LguiA_009954 [Lonicera macranthoides]